MSLPRLATTDDRTQLIDTLVAGFTDDPVMSWVFAGPDTSRKLQAFFGFLVDQVLVPLGASYLTDGACALWTPAGTPEWSPVRGQAFTAMLTDTCPHEDVERFSILREHMAARALSEPNWHLNLLAARPTHQGQGHGSSLLAHTLPRTAGLPCSLDSTNPRNVSLYLRHGFVITDESALPGGAVVTAMRRPAG